MADYFITKDGTIWKRHYYGLTTDHSIPQRFILGENTMTTEFTASNGVTIETRHDGYLVVEDGPTTDWMGPRTADAVREYFTNERDVELGRWRSKNHPDYVVYALPDQPGAIDIMNERATASHRCFEHCFHLAVDTFKWGAVKDEYLAAHPEPKPEWHDAKAGEVWLLDIKDDLKRETPAVVNGQPEFRTYLGEEFDLDSPQITDATRIWPEPEESDDE